MLKSLLLAVLAASVAVGIGMTQQSNVKVTIPVNKTSATSGKQMFTSYCAPCHGVDGKGRGPASPALKTPPNDLTMLSRSNHGKFPEVHIVSVLQFGIETTAHGSADMPVWGPILGKMNKANGQEKQLRISNLSSYLESIQAK
jgi:mono/diheme cytochrome c family protein